MFCIGLFKMKLVYVQLMDAVRKLSLRVTARGDKEFVKIGISGQELQRRLIDLQKALDAVDKEMGETVETAEKSQDANTTSELEDVYRDTIDALVSMVKHKTQDTRGSHLIIEDAVQNFLDKRKARKKVKTLKFKPSSGKSKKDGEVKLNFKDDPLADFTEEKAQRMGYRSEIAAQGLGAALADVNAQRERLLKKAQSDRENARIREEESIQRALKGEDDIPHSIEDKNILK